MATVVLLPNQTVSAGSNWTLTGEGTHHEALDDDNGDTSYTACSTNDEVFSLQFEDIPDDSSDIASVTSVQFLSSGRCPARGSGGSDVEIGFVSPSSGFLETMNYFNNANYEAENGTVRTQTPAGADWTPTSVHNIRLKLRKDGTTDVRLSYFAVKKTGYTANSSILIKLSNPVENTYFSNSISSGSNQNLVNENFIGVISTGSSSFTYSDSNFDNNLLIVQAS